MKENPFPHFPAARGHSAKRTSILEAAARVFCREGFAGANIDLIAAEAGVSRQTVYNHHGDKENLLLAVVKDITDRSNAGLFATLATFPDQPKDLEAELIAFAVRLNQNCICSKDGKFLRKLIESEGERNPELFAGWRDEGPLKTWSALAARFARLAYSGHLEIDDPDVAARQFLALISADLQLQAMFGEIATDEQIRSAATNAVRTFLRAYRPRVETPAPIHVSA
ncbi:MULTISPECIES: TetR/AcrR family transcriptional regulator [unclassified Mesorhizobium]|uniref:TetR/AcrR family transcriptional regulator n=1 Tax=unclassified Mesorhizobium TaxID=325217 RepID=UPI0008E591A2|nr:MULTISPECIES: TetR/AcrR family transcriptional regulator [unclassified Mesorhizobium]RJG44619.1 TetR/AcrR family transcriptional regulator [Mesorhizobium sp. DCY119]SFU03168.1 transcriptional regulator, TetR family [Mesorhizobium sp. YR577]